MTVDLLRRAGRIVLLAMLAVGAPALAAPSNASPLVQVSGFATLGAVKTDRDDVWFTRYGVNYPGDSDPDFSPDSLLGLQASLRLSAYNDITVQMLMREDGEESYDPRITLAFFRQTLAPGLSLRLGRLRVPFFMLSDSLHINYANPWVRPPVEVYSLNPFNDLDGVDLVYHTRLGALDTELHPYFGRGRVPFPMGRARLKATWGLNVALSRGDFSLHLGHGDGRFSMVRGDPETHSLVAALSRAGLSGVAADLSGTDGSTRFDSVGLQWDDGTWQVVSEYARRRANRYATSSSGWYVSVGRRFGPLTPYAVIARQRLDEQMAEAAVPAGLQHAWDEFLTSRNNAQRSFTVGTRWDVTSFAAVKAEVTRTRVDSDSWGSYFPRGGRNEAAIAGKRMNTFSLSLDLTF
ncbi:MAG: hypothetical protein ROZ37_16695 [Aromatoleum sp.]|jgi:hypothetical protein|uniref:hypothetical protein n=1 Tax=Aromatoleum sp. TaxID=2307007 RepID=UPI002895700A|nr:hypothetical protein [Aromatoleum sp.]MDT3671959.1 hypothetical protein [Aromatoleum sp.]